MIATAPITMSNEAKKPFRITIATVVRNCASMIDSTIQSVLSQNYPEIEYLIHDGASDDGTQQIISNYGSKITSFVSEQDGGIADAFNKVSKRATGDAILFLNAGDTFIDSDTITRMVSLIPTGIDIKNSIIYGDSTVIYPRGQVTVVGDHLQLASRCSICHQSTLIGIEIQRAYAYDARLKFKMDYDLWLRCRGKFSFHRVPMVVCNYLAGGNSGDRRTAARASFEMGIVQLLNMSSRRNVVGACAIATKFFLIAAKKRMHLLIGDRPYALVKRAFGYSDINIVT